MMLDVISKDPDESVVRWANLGAHELSVNRDELLLAWTQRLDWVSTGKDFWEVVGKLAQVIEHDGSSRMRDDESWKAPEARKALKARWVKFIQEHREEIRTGKVFEVTDPRVTVDLMPKQMWISVKGKDWPAREGE